MESNVGSRRPKVGRALVTGASSGIGEAFARRLAEDGYDLVLTARRADRLEALAQYLRTKHGVAVEVVVADLAEPGAPARVAEAALSAGPIDFLVNNAGYGMFGAFAELSTDRQLAMIRLNVGALVDLTGRLVGPMRERRRGTIVLVGSTAAFQPVPYDGVYAATKAFVLSFGEAIAEELRGDGVQVMTLCPGLTRTEFVGAASAISREIDAPNFGWMSADAVVRWAMRGLRWRLAFVVAGVLNWIVSLLARHAPRILVRRATGAMFRKVLRRRESKETFRGLPPPPGPPGQA